MANEFDILITDTTVKNTGVVGGGYDPKNIEAVILIPAGTVMTHAQMLVKQTTVEAGLANDDPALRWHMIKRFEGCEAKNVDAKYYESPYGDRSKSMNGKYGWRFQYRDGGLGLHTKIYSFDGKQDLFDLFLVDGKNNVLWGVKSGTGMKGFAINMIDVPNIDVNNGSDPSKYYFEIQLEDERELNKNSRVLQFPDDFNVVSDFDSLIDTEMAVATPMDATGLVSLRFTSGNGVKNLGDNFSGTLDDLSLYSASVTNGGADLDVDSVAWNAATKCVDVQLDATDPDFPASGTDITIVFGPAPSDIDTAGMPGYSEAQVTTPLG